MHHGENNKFEGENRMIAKIEKNKYLPLIDNAINIKNKLYFIVSETPGALYIYDLDQRVIEDIIVLPIIKAVLCNYKDELWLISRESKKIIVYSLVEKKTVYVLPLNVFYEQVFQTIRPDLKMMLLQKDECLWIFTLIGIIEIDMEKRCLYVYRYLEAGLGAYNEIYTVQLVDKKIYMFGKCCFVYDIKNKRLEKWLSGKRLLSGCVDHGRVISVPIERKDSELKITDLRGKVIYTEKLSLTNLSHIDSTYKYWFSKPFKDLCLFLPYGVEGIIVYSMEKKTFTRWECHTRLYQVLEYKNVFLCIGSNGQIIYYDKNGKLLGIDSISISCDTKHQLVEKYAHMTNFFEQLNEQLEHWLNDFQENLLEDWKNVDTTPTIAKDIWKNIKSYLKGKNGVFEKI